MKIELIKGDITKIEIDAIVNAANTSLLGGGGVDGAIHRAGGKAILDECMAIRNRQGGCDVGEAVITTAGNLPAKKVIHTVGPVWNNEQSNEDEKLKNCYLNSLRLAEANGLRSIAFPNISTGVYRFPKAEAAKIAIETVKGFSSTIIERVVFVCFDEENLALYDKELIPERALSTIRFDTPNQEIQVYNGPAVLIIDSEILNISSVNINVNWYPKFEIKFNTFYDTTNSKELKAIFGFNKFELEIDGLIVGDGNISQVISETSTYIEGTFNSKVIIGDKSINCKEIDFALINFKQFFGNSIKETHPNGSISYTKGRIQLEDNDFIVIFDKIEKANERLDLLRNTGGYLQFYDGKIISKNTHGISHTKTFELISKLATFLTFINGRRVCPLFLTGNFENEIIWQDYTPYINNSPYKSCPSWSNKFHIDGFNSLWDNFSMMWKDENAQDVLKTVIHWYVEANNNSGYVEGALVMAQTALELLYNWYVVEKKVMITGKDSESISASNKIRLLLTSLNYFELDTPSSFNELESFISNSKSISNCIEAIVFIRNSIIHSQVKKRIELNKITSKAKYESLQLSIWYIEIALLRILKYDGEFRNRTQKKIWN